MDRSGKDVKEVEVRDLLCAIEKEKKADDNEERTMNVWPESFEYRAAGYWAL